jgi:hypothetical protein
MKTFRILGILLVIGLLCVLYKNKYHGDEGYSSGGFSVTSGLSYYNTSICSPGNIEGSSSPYCETIGPVGF